jgi:hypothetical protein
MIRRDGIGWRNGSASVALAVLADPTFLNRLNQGAAPPRLAQAATDPASANNLYRTVR